MADKNNEEKKKKNPAPAAKSVKRRKKKGPPAAVKIPAGMSLANISFLLFTFQHYYIHCLGRLLRYSHTLVSHSANSFSHNEMQASPAEA